MSKFDAAKAVEPLEYDFKPYADVSGTVPEPTDDQVAKFYGDLGHQFELALGEERLEGHDMTEPADVAGLYLSLDADDHSRIYEQMLNLHAEVCSGQPDRDAIAALPFRLRRAWYGMVQGWLRPEVSTPATND